MGNLLPSTLSSGLPLPCSLLGHPLLNCTLAWSHAFLKTGQARIRIFCSHKKADCTPKVSVRNALILESDWPCRCRCPLKMILRSCRHFSSIGEVGFFFLTPKVNAHFLPTFAEMIEWCSLTVESCLGSCWPTSFLHVADEKWGPFPITATLSITK